MTMVSEHYADEMYVCKECLNKYYRRCGHCGEYWAVNDMITVDNISICGNCYEEDYM